MSKRIQRLFLSYRALLQALSLHSMQQMAALLECPIDVLSVVFVFQHQVLFVLKSIQVEGQ